MKDFAAKIIFSIFLLFTGISYAQQGINMEDLRGWYGSEDVLKPVLTVEDSVCVGNVVLITCTNCAASEGLFWAVQGGAEIIRKAGTSMELLVIAAGPVRVALERENYWGIGRQAVTFEALGEPFFLMDETAFLCKNDSLDITIDSLYAAYQWSDGVKSANRKIYSPGIYSVRVTAYNGCSYSRKIHIRRKSPPVPNLGPDRFTCNSNRPQLYPGEFDSYFWQNGSKDSLIQADFPGTYWVRVTDGCGQQATDTVRIIDKKLPAIELGEDQVLCAGDTLLIEAGNDYSSYRWNNGLRGNSLPVWASGSYTVSASDESGCIIKDEIRVEVVPCSKQLTMPLRISPNGDKLNEQFRLLNQQEASSLSMQIFSQDGLLLYYSDQKNQGWNGRFDQKKVPAGSYPYTIQYRDSQGKQQYLSGFLNVE